MLKHKIFSTILAVICCLLSSYASYARFVEPDPIGQEDDSNIYVYCQDAPLTFSDPSGLQTGVLPTPIGPLPIIPLPQTPAQIEANEILGRNISRIYSNAKTDAQVNAYMFWAIVYGTTPQALSNAMFRQGCEQGRNWATELAKAKAQANPGKSPCDFLAEMLAHYKSTGDTRRIQDILQAQKFMGCRNIQKRRN